MAKNKDLFLDMMANPGLGIEDLVSVGHSAENSRFLDKGLYQSSERVRNAFKDKEGNFDLNAFDNFYELASRAYANITDKEVNKSIINATAYDADNIWVSPEKRTLNTAPVLTLGKNPDRLKSNIFRVGRISERDRSIDELAQAEKVLMNPTAVAKGEKPIYADSPNDSWWDKFWDTQVLAQWDEDGTHIDPVTGLEETHKKGDLKLNENGTYYYEDLDGRDIYGRRVLNKLNTITTDGTFWNQYDFMDSDDIQSKSLGGSIMKNLALVGSMFIPYVGWGVALASVATLTAGLAGTLGKMLTGSDSPTFSAWEGFAKSFDRRNAKTEESLLKMLTWENFIDLIGDTTAQLREQRAIFKFVPAILKGKYGMSDSGLNELKNKIATDLNKEVTEGGLTIGQLYKMAAKSENPREMMGRLINGKDGIIAQAAEEGVRKYFNDYNKLGEQISRAYMTAITVADTYGEAKEAGATDSEATLLTLGYAAAENRLLRSDIGRWIMPELKADRQRYKMIGKALTELPKEARDQAKTLKQLSGESKKEWMKRLFNIGKYICNAEYSVGKTGIAAAIANGLSEGVEEVSEELLGDFSKACFNVVLQLQGDDDVRMSAFTWDQDMLTRYGMSFAGGIIGGTINSAATDFKQLHPLKGMNSRLAMEHLVWMERNGETKDFWDVINRTTIGNKNLSTQVNEDGTFKPGTEYDNQDLEAKKAIRNQLDIVRNLLLAEGAALDDNGLLGQVMSANPKLKGYDIVGLFRANALAKSLTAGRYMNEYNKICANIIGAQMKLNEVEKNSKPSDSAEPTIGADSSVKSLKLELKKWQDKKDALLNGERTAEFYRDALFETNFGVSEVFISPTEVQYMELKSGKKYSDLTDEEKEQLKKDYANWSTSGDRADLIHQMAEIYWGIATQSSAALQQSADLYDQINAGRLLKLNDINKFSKYKLEIISKSLKNDDKDAIASIQELLMNVNKDMGNAALQADPARGNLSDLQAFLANADELQLKFEVINNDTLMTPTLKKIAYYDATFDSIFKPLALTAEEIIQSGYAHPEVKNVILPALRQLSELAIEYSSEVEGANPDLEEKYIQMSEAIDEYHNQILKLTATPIVENLRQFAIGLGTDKSVMDIIEYVIDKEKKNATSVDLLLLDPDSLEQFDEAEKILKLYRASIAGARVDNADLENPFGYNKTLNQVARQMDGYVPLAEINKETADLAIQDVNMAIDRLSVTKGIHDLNSGNKLNVQNHVAVNKSLILWNKTQRFITSLLDDDDIKNNWEGLSELATAINSVNLHRSLYNTDVSLRTLSVNTLDRQTLEEESLNIENAIYDFFLKNSSKLNDAKEVAKLIDKGNFTLFKLNNEILTQDSKDIDDNAFVWWLASKAALKADSFYNEYRNIISDEGDEKPVAPIPTQELGIYAAVAAVVNGDMFLKFGAGLKEHLVTKWNSLESSERERISKENKLGIGDDANFIKGSDVVPNFNSIIFVEGIPGSGKSTGVFDTITKILDKANIQDASGNQIKVFDLGVMVVHTDKDNADHLASNMSFSEGTNVVTKGKEDMLKWMSALYRNAENPVSGEFEYYLHEDAEIVDGVARSTWEINKTATDIPKVLFIDEWSRYTLLEADLILRFAQFHGIQIIAGGDLDLLSPQAYLMSDKTKTKDSKDTLKLSMARSITPRVAKLGVSMRTGNGQKSYNLHVLLAWRLNPKDTPIDLKFVETEDHKLYGDKVINQDGALTSAQLTQVLADILKMIDDLKDGEKIGYIFSDTDSALYKWALEDTRKDKFDFKNEASAQGREARYYVVENNRNRTYKTRNSSGTLVELERDADDYFKSVYTGISRAEQASIVIAPATKIGNLFIQNPRVLEDKLIPDSYSQAGVRRFAKARKDSLNNIYNAKSGIAPISYTERTKEEITVAPTTTPTAATGTTLPSVASTPIPAPTVTPSPTTTSTPTTTTGTTTSTTSAPTPAPSTTITTPTTPTPTTPTTTVTPVTPPVTPPTPSYEGKLPIGSKVYSPTSGRFYGEITDYIKDENLYKVEWEGKTPITISGDLFDNGSMVTTEVPAIHSYKVGDAFFDKHGTRWVVSGEKITTDNLYQYTLMDNNSLNITTVTDANLSRYLNDGTYTLPPTVLVDDEVFVADNPLAILGEAEYEEAIGEMLNSEAEAEEAKEEVVAVSHNGKDITFDFNGYTFNTQYIGFDFNPDGTPNIDYSQGGLNRIDNGHGLYKLPGRQKYFSNRDNILKVLGLIRSAGMFQSNADIINEFKKAVGLKNEEFTIDWGFVSKSKKPYTKNDKYSRYYYDANQRLENMVDEPHAEIPIKTLSMIFRDRNGNAVLEIPMITLASPFTVLHKLSKVDPSHPVSTAYNAAMLKAKSNPRMTMALILTEVLLAINNMGGGPNLHRLERLCELWKFTNNGFKKLPDGWNLSEKGKNLGIKYVKYRTTEQTILNGYGRFNMSPQWHDLTEEVKRKDANYSHIMMGNVDSFNDTYVFKAGHPFVLRSDDLRIKGDQALMAQYIKQQMPGYNGPQSVKLIPITPPEISISNYLTNLFELRRNGTANRWGNDFTNVRILQAIRNTDLFNNVPAKLRQEVIEILDKFANATVTPEVGDTRISMMSKLYKAQKDILNEQGADAINYKLNNVLYNIISGAGPTGRILKNGEFGNDNVLIKIEEACKAAGVTGVLAKLSEVKNSSPVAGYGYLIKVDNESPYSIPGGGSFRIYSKFDSPKYDLESLLDDISAWADDTYIGKNGFANMWGFRTAAADEDLYLAYLNTAQSNQPTPKLQFDLKYNSLLGKLGLNILVIPDNVLTEKEYIDAILKAYRQTPGNIGFGLGTTLYCGNLLDTDPRATCKFPDGFDKLRQIGLEKDENIDSALILHMIDPDNKKVDIRIEYNKNDDTYQVIFDKETPAPAQPIITERLVKYKESLQKAITLSNDEKMNTMFNRVIEIMDTVSPDLVILAISSEFNDSDGFQLMLIADVCEDENMFLSPISLSLKDDLNIDPCPSFITKKFIR